MFYGWYDTSPKKSIVKIILSEIINFLINFTTVKPACQHEQDTVEYSSFIILSNFWQKKSVFHVALFTANCNLWLLQWVTRSVSIPNAVLNFFAPASIDEAPAEVQLRHIKPSTESALYNSKTAFAMFSDVGDLR